MIDHLICCGSDRTLSSSPPKPKRLQFRRSAVKVRVEYTQHGQIRHYFEYGVALGFFSVQPFAGLGARGTVARVGYFETEHMHVSGLTLVKGFKLRHDDQFISVRDLENSSFTLNKTRSCDPAGWSNSAGAFVVLEF